ncbi:trigger factor [Tannerella forsythia]|uniref:Trigger factor n=1 Tax=Tannerella forsythia TaxID=28112 RepID=A0A3P1Z204_TANFO|nr:trigger factor [Tannerella forsythia]RRD77371.1 trigger factor [Tannerella forsythia]
MNVSLKSNDSVSGVVTVAIEKKDYEAQIEKSLRQYRQKANMPGFRKGMVPLGMIKKMYGKYVLAEEINRIASESLFNYIRENNIAVLGQPVPCTDHPTIDFETQESFEFRFDIALAPTLDIKLTKRDKLTRYEVEVDDVLIDKQVDSYRRSFGSYDSVEDVEETDLVKGTVVEMEDGEQLPGGIWVEEAMLMPKYIKDEGERNKFLGAKLNDKVVFNPNKAYEGAEAEIASFLKVKKEEVAGITRDFRFEIKEITRHKPSDLNQELFDKIFGEGVVKSEAEFRDRVKESLQEQFRPQSDYKFFADVRALMLKKTADVTFADDILKRWLLKSDEKNTPEMVEKDYPHVVEDLKAHLAKEQLVRAHDIKVEDADIESLAKRVAQAQFAQYGMLSVPDDVLDNYAKDMMKKEETVRNLVDRVIDEKLAEWLKEQVKVETKTVSLDEFEKLLTEKQK